MVRPCERYCPECKKWKHYSRFYQRRRRRHNGSVVEPDLVCKDCRQIERTEGKNADRPLALMRSRTQSWARRLGVTTDFLWTNMNWRALVPLLRAMMSPEGLCLSCGHPFLNERDIHLEHRYPPRHSHDWARHHARNIWLDCDSCNKRKGPTPYGEWLDNEEEARLVNEQWRASDQSPLSEPVQLSLDLA